MTLLDVLLHKHGHGNLNKIQSELSPESRPNMGRRTRGRNLSRVSRIRNIGVQDKKKKMERKNKIEEKIIEELQRLKLEKDYKGPFLPPEIWAEIGKRHQCRFDIARFRSVCRSWRDRIPLPSLFPLTIPPPPGPLSPALIPIHYFLTEITFYAADQTIFVFEEEYCGTFTASVLVPVNRPYKFKGKLPSFENLSSRLSFLCKSYHIHNAYPGYGYDAKLIEGKFNFDLNHNVIKTVIITDSPSVSLNPNYASMGGLIVVGHMKDCSLAVLRLGGENNWENGFCSIEFEDIVEFRGGLVGVDRWGKAFVMDCKSLETRQIVPALPGYTPPSPSSSSVYKKSLHLAVHLGVLYVFFDDSLYKMCSKMMEWVEVGEENDQIFFVRDTHCNFGVARDLFSTQFCRNRYDMPRLCRSPHFVYRRLALDLNKSIDYHPVVRSRRMCDLGWLP